MTNIFFSNNFIVRDDYLLLSFREFLQKKILIFEIFND